MDTFYTSSFSDIPPLSTASSTVVDELCNYSLPKITKKKKVVKKKSVVAKIGDPSSPSAQSFAPSASLQMSSGVTSLQTSSNAKSGDNLRMEEESEM